MRAAKGLGMTNGHFAFVTLDLNTDAFYKNGVWTGTEGENSTLFPPDLDGIVDLSVHRPSVSGEFSQRYKNAMRSVQADIVPLLTNNVSFYWGNFFCSTTCWALSALFWQGRYGVTFHVNVVCCGSCWTKPESLPTTVLCARDPCDISQVTLENETSSPPERLPLDKDRYWVSDSCLSVNLSIWNVFYTIKCRTAFDFMYPPLSKTAVIQIALIPTIDLSDSVAQSVVHWTEVVGSSSTWVRFFLSLVKGRATWHFSFPN